jgi:sporulation protein YlmC with PRC-barrel domain
MPVRQYGSSTFGLPPERHILGEPVVVPVRGSRSLPNGTHASPFSFVLHATAPKEAAMSDTGATTSTGGSNGGVAVNETDRLIASDKVEGTAVYDHQGNRLGSVYNVMIDKFSGQVAYAVMSFGGLLGIGERYHSLPWKMLTYDTGLGGYVVDVTREQLERAPSYARDETPWGDPDYGRDIYTHYGLPYGTGL